MDALLAASIFGLLIGCLLKEKVHWHTRYSFCKTCHEEKEEAFNLLKKVDG